MANRPVNGALGRLRDAVLRDTAGATDEQLLEAYLARRDPAALEVLVRRHGPMVWGVCRRLLGHHDAEDAFQATFFVLVRKAGSIVSRAVLASWLHGVARRTALKARTAATRRAARERLVAAQPELSPPPLRDDLHEVLDRELGLLPEKYRAVLVLCDLQGLTRKEAAARLRTAEGTVASRLARARAALARRLTRHGLAVAAAEVGVVLAEDATAAGVPAGLRLATLRAVADWSEGMANVAGVAPRAAALAEGVLKAMALTRLKTATAVLLAVGVLGAAAGTAFLPSATATQDKYADPRVAQPAPEDVPTVQIRVIGPKGMKVSVLVAAKAEALPAEVPARFNLPEGHLTRLKLIGIPNRPGLVRYPSVEVPKAQPATDAYLRHSAIPLFFKDEDFDRVEKGEAVTKVIYLESPRGGTVTLTSWEQPDIDVIAEAKKRGTILAVVRLGDIDLGADRGLDSPVNGKKTADDPLQAQRDRQMIEEQKLTKAVADSITQANRIYPTSPDKALDQLRTVLLQVWDHPDLSEACRETLLTRIVAARKRLGSEK
jgi:RNA polymerase sigma factor (sigma-70 family)